MARFSLRPIFRRLSSKHSVTAESSASDVSESTNITSTSPSPNLPGCTATPTAPRKSTSLAKLRDKFRAHDADIPEFPEELRSGSIPSLDTAGVVPSIATRRRVASDPADKDAAVVHTHELGSVDGSGSPRSKPEPHNNNSQQPPELKLDIDQLPVAPQVLVEEPTPEALGRESRQLDSFE